MLCLPSVMTLALERLEKCSFLNVTSTSLLLKSIAKFSASFKVQFTLVTFGTVYYVLAWPDLAFLFIFLG